MLQQPTTEQISILVRWPKVNYTGNSIKFTIAVSFVFPSINEEIDAQWERNTGSLLVEPI